MQYSTTAHNDINVGELYAILAALQWLKVNRHAGDRRRELHFVTDSDRACKYLTDPGVHCIYYSLVQRVRRLAAELDNYDIYLNWIPSHLGDECTPRTPELEVEGNGAADAEAKSAARNGRASMYVHESLETWTTYKNIIREAARLVCDVERLFPLAEKVKSPRKSGPAVLKPSEVDRLRSKPGDDGDGNVT